MYTSKKYIKDTHLNMYIYIYLYLFIDKFITKTTCALCLTV